MRSAGLPISVPMDRAVETIRALRPAERGGTQAPFIVGITGPVGAGKSTLAGALSPCVIATDHYLPDYHATPEHERDLPERADLARLLLDLTSLRAGRPTPIPRWCFHAHARTGETIIEPGEMIVVEGLHALHPTHAPALDVRVYVDAPPDVRLERWVRIAASGQRGWGVEQTRSFFANVAEPTFHSRAAGYRAGADVIVVNG